MCWVLVCFISSLLFRSQQCHFFCLNSIYINAIACLEHLLCRVPLGSASYSQRQCWGWDVEYGAPSFVEAAAAEWFASNAADQMVWAASLFTPSSSSVWFSLTFEVTLKYLAGGCWAGWVFLHPSLTSMQTGAPKTSLLLVIGSLWCCPLTVSAVSCTSAFASLRTSFYVPSYFETYEAKKWFKGVWLPRCACSVLSCLLDSYSFSFLGSLGRGESFCAVWHPAIGASRGVRMLP